MPFYLRSMPARAKVQRPSPFFRRRPKSVRLKLERSGLSRWLQYLYFLRFPLFGFLMLPVLCGLDAFTGADAITRGIMTLSRMWQAFYVAFFVPALGMTVFICAKNIVRNGEDRFGTKAPAVLRLFLRGPNTRATWFALAFTQVPTVLTLAYSAWVTIREEERAAFGAGFWQLWAGYALGLLAAITFWYMVSFFYIWLHPAVAPPKDGPTSPGQLIKPAEAILFPEPDRANANPQDAPQAGYAPDPKPGSSEVLTIPLLPTPTRLLLAAQNADQPNYAVGYELLTRGFLKISFEGYAASPRASIWPLHLLSAVALGAFLFVYFFTYPLTAPVYFSSGFVTSIMACLLMLGCYYGARTRKGTVQPIGWFFTGAIAAMLLLLLIFLAIDYATKQVRLETAFPVLASLLVIFIFFQWLITGVSFFLDRYRVPVMTAVLALIFIPKVLPIDQDHYFEVKKSERITEVDTPSLAVDHRVLDDKQPYIIVTATGGGIRAAEWTAQVMAQLEKNFAADPTLAEKDYHFHDHVLLLSGVSGGSVGLMPYLLEYTAQAPFAGDRDFSRRLTEPPACTSLEAVAWGLEYYDLQRLVMTWRPSWFGGSYTPDRTWALTRALNRNLHDNDSGCVTGKLHWPQGMLDGRDFTLGKAAALLRQGSMPAFTFNTTVAETGGRFLLSNYAVPQEIRSRIGRTDFMPAESFLQAYAQESRCDEAQVRKDCYLDLDLATAARLSATFPVVSSATRIPKQYATTAHHFLDGGYFDNDGTASVIEFLYSALDRRGWDQSAPASEEESVSTSSTPAALHHLKLLLVEIRDGDDMNPTKNVDDWKHQVGSDLETGASQPGKWGLLNQIMAPLEGLWNAGHVSTTRRNRRELCLLEHNYANRGQGNLEIHHVVLGIPPEPEPNQPDHFRTPPLNWKLTASQRKYLEAWATEPGKPTQKTIAEAISWVGKHSGSSVNTVYPACEIEDQVYMRR